MVRGEAPVVQVCVWESEKSGSERHVRRETGLREGMWVNTLEGIGIIRRILGSGQVEVMLTHQDGTNRIELRVHQDTLRQSRIEDIPECRRPSYERGQVLGYA